MNAVFLGRLAAIHRALWAGDRIYRVALLALPVLFGVAVASGLDQAGRTVPPHQTSLGSASAPQPPAPAPAPAREPKIHPGKPLPAQTPTPADGDRGYHSPFE